MTNIQDYIRYIFRVTISEALNAETMEQLQLFADLKRPVDNVALIEETLGEVIDLTKNCPECGKSDYIEDNREKKASDPKFSKIPSWSCSNYKDNDGCGWTGWGDTDCPTEWLQKMWVSLLILINLKRN